ncbi:metal ABC transporter permease [Ectothiorhodospiraceae bacterium 2226]|nr:metal ABC transporter permease [Ectothiorhodospiraceae bacterium 2226]
MMELVLDPLFLTPFLVGLVLVPLVALLGAYLRLREEWLASLSYAQVAAAGGMLSALLAVPVLGGAVAAAAVAGAGKTLLARPSNDFYALLILLGWSTMLLLAVNHPMGETLGHALVDGQLYFVGHGHLISVLVLLVATAALMPWLGPRLLRARLFPDHDSANRAPQWRYKLTFELLVVAVIATAVTAVGVIAAFALVFLPAWAAFRRGANWRATLGWSVALATAAYLVAFAGALVFDQPFGPVLVAVLGLLCVAARVVR